MSVNFLLVYLLCYICKCASVEVQTHVTPTTTKVYDLDVLGANPIRIVEGEDLWKKVEDSAFTTTTSTTNLNSPLSELEKNSAEFSHAALKDFLDSYAEKVSKNKESEHGTSDEDKEGKKHWSLMNLRQHDHPHEDKKGWITLEPVPWSLSKISKWQSKSTTTEHPWDDFASIENKPPQNIDYSLDRVSIWNKPSAENNYYYGSSSHNTKKGYHNYHHKPHYPKPSAVYGQTVHLHAPPDHENRPVKPGNHYNHDRNCNHKEDFDIITDGRPSNFPSNYYQNSRSGTDLPAEAQPHITNGEWVLLSTTKGYRLPKSKQRSLDINPQSIGTHQSVRLTVLPPLKDSQVNMTTSHGGLLQVDSSFETVEQAQKKYIKMQKLKGKPKRPAKPIKKRKLSSSTIATITRNTAPDGSAVLAAVGAGMIPATMAMLVPFAMNGKRRKRRNVSVSASNPTSKVQITLPRYI